MIVVCVAGQENSHTTLLRDNHPSNSNTITTTLKLETVDLLRYKHCLVTEVRSLQGFEIIREFGCNGVN